MIEKLTIGITETDDNNQNAVAIFKPAIESLSLTEKSHEIITVPAEEVAMPIVFGTGITVPKIIILKANGVLLIGLTVDTDVIELTMNADETYRLPAGIEGITVTNESTTTDVILEKIIGE